MTDHNLNDEADRYRNALQWVRSVAFMHYFGGAFDPEHMRDIGNIAADALAGKIITDHDEAMGRAQDRARLMAASWGAELVTPNNEEET